MSDELGARGEDTEADEAEVGPFDAAMRETAVSAIAVIDAPVARPDTDIEALRRARVGQDLPIPVVDEQGTLVGLVRPGDVGDDRGCRVEPDGVERGRDRLLLTDAVQPPRRAADVMMPLVFYVPSDASLARAVALLVEEGVTYAPLVSPGGRYAGMIDGLAIMRWLATISGFVVPERSRMG